MIRRFCVALGIAGLRWFFGGALMFGLGVAAYGLMRIWYELHGVYLVPAPYPDVAYWVVGGVIAVLGGGGLAELSRHQKR